MDWNFAVQVSTILGALGQLITGVMLMVLAMATYRYTKSQNNASLIRYLNDMLNDWDKVLLSDEKNMEILNKIRPAIINPRTDNILFLLLNYLNSCWIMSQGNLVDQQHTLFAIDNGANILSGVSREDVSRLLDCGFDPKFKQLVLERLDRISKQKAQPLARSRRWPWKRAA